MKSIIKLSLVLYSLNLVLLNTGSPFTSAALDPKNATATEVTSPPSQPPLTNQTSTSSPSIPAAVTNQTILINPTSTSSPRRKQKTAGECPKVCTCIEGKIDCGGKGLTDIPNLTNLIGYTSVNLSNNSITALNFFSLPMNYVFMVDVSYNKISTISTPIKKDSLPNLLHLDLSNNPELKNISSLSYWKFPILERLDLGSISINSIAKNTFNSMKALKRLDLSGSKLSIIDQSAFESLVNLEILNMSSCEMAYNTLDDKLFAKIAKLKTLDLSNNFFVDVPSALRLVHPERLLLNNNSMSTLRNSDFISQELVKRLEICDCPNLVRVEEGTFSDMFSLKTLKMANNPRLEYFSNDAFKSSRQIHLEELNLGGNNFSTLQNPFTFTSFLVDYVNLADNPWKCNCDLQWLSEKLPRSLAHCKSPEKFKDLEISQFFQMIDCEARDSSSYQTIIVTGFLLFLLGLTVAVFVQKSDICRRLQWRDQYGTIYYTKASFPPENV